MKKDTDLCITIIGLGNLMEAIFPCIVETIGRENLYGQVNATTTDQPDVKRKQEALGIPVSVNDNLAALKSNKPDIIFFAPPPRAAPDIIGNEFKAYYTYLREAAAPLPEIYAFPPTPPGAFYEKILGEDILVVNILPQPVLTIGGKQVKQEGFYSRTFSRAWPPENKARLQRIFRTMGEGVELRPHEIGPMLGAWIMIEVLSEVATTLADTISPEGRTQEARAADHRPLAKYMRAKARQTRGSPHGRNTTTETEFLEAPLQLLLDSVVLAWHEGLGAYFQELDFPRDLGRRIINMLMDFQLHILEIEQRSVVDVHTAKAATKGGVLEKGVLCYHQTIAVVLKRAVEQRPETPTEKWLSTLRTKVKTAAHVVREHGMTLSG